MITIVDTINELIIEYESRLGYRPTLVKISPDKYDQLLEKVINATFCLDVFVDPFISGVIVE